MFEGLRYKEDFNNNQNYQNTTEVKDNDKKYHICIGVSNDDSYIVDDCRENWDILNDINNVDSNFVLFKDTKDSRTEIMGIRADKIVAFYLEEDE